MDKSEIKELFERYKNGQCTEEELRLLREWAIYGDFEDEELSKEEMLKDLTSLEPLLPLRTPNARRLLYLRVAAYAASLVFVLGMVYYFYQHSFSGTFLEENPMELATLEPGSNKAVLQLDDGSLVVLDTLAQNQRIQLDDAWVQLNEEGQLVYLPQEGSRVAKNNQIITPKGGQYEIILPDGTQVWLNSDSKLAFANNFENQIERRVTLEGEAYFNVSKDADHPFVVSVKEQQVKVLGTEFNVNAYVENAFIKTSLVEGSVLFNADCLSPGESALFENNKTTVYADNIDDVIAWKNGYFVFFEESLEEAMQKVARWYDLEISFADKETKSILFGGSISKYENAIEVFNMIEKAGDVKIIVEGKKATVHKGEVHKQEVNYDKMKG